MISEFENIKHDLFMNISSNAVTSVKEVHQITDIECDYKYRRGGKIIYDVDIINSKYFLENGSKIVLKYLSFVSDVLTSVEMFKACTEKCMFEILEDNVPVCSFDFSLLFGFVDVIHNSNNGINYFTIAVPKFMVSDVYIDNDVDDDNYYAVRLIFNTNQSILEDGYLGIDRVVTDYVYLSRTCGSIESCQSIKYVASRSKHLETSNSKYRFTLKSKQSCVKGYLIECDVDKLKGFLIQINGHDYFDMYDYIKIRMLCHKINDRLMYFSYNGDDNYADIDKKSFYGAINHILTDHVVMMLDYGITYDDEIKIYSVGLFSDN